MTPPNVLLIMSDDQRFDFLTYMPNVRNLIAFQGREFTAARCNVALCQPTRVSLLFGQNSKRHHVINNSTESLASLNHANTIAKWVQLVGYRTGLVGKYLNGAPPMQPKPGGWNTWRQLVDPTDADSFGYSICDGTNIITPPAFQMDYLRDEALAFVAGAQPWFLLLATSSPHIPFSPEPADLFAWSDFRLPLVNEEDVSDKPTWIRNQPPQPASARSVFRETARGQLRELTGIDRAIGQIINSLPPAVLANTLIVFTSDNGLEYGEHRRPFQGITKNVPYEVGLHVPLVMRGPGIPVGTTEEPVNVAADVTATIVGVTGATAAVTPDGVDLRDMIADPASFSTRQLLHEKGVGLQFGEIPAGHGITTKTRKLYRYVLDGSAPETDRYEAYDLDTDPNEFINWANDPSRLTERNALEAALDVLLNAP